MSKDFVTLSEVLTATSFTTGIGGLSLPLTATLVSTAVGRLIELSADGGTTYFTPTLEIDVTALAICTISNPITNIRVTGDIGDTFTLLGK